MTEKLKTFIIKKTNRSIYSGFFYKHLLFIITNVLMAYTYKYPRPMVTVDAVIFAHDDKQDSIEVLLIERLSEPYKGFWALPGGFIEMDETLDESIARELKEETGLESLSLKQFQIFGNPGRDPRGRTITIAYWCMESKSRLKPVAGSDAKSLKWFPLHQLPSLAFDHKEIIEKAKEEAGL